MQENNVLLAVLAQAQKTHEEVGLQLIIAEELINRNDLETAYRAALTLVRSCEKLALTARALPAYTGNAGAMVEVEDQMAEVTPVALSFTPEGWFTLKMPFLLPQKRGKELDFLLGLLYPQFRRFFKNQNPVMFPEGVLVFRHVYDRTRPDRQWRDHDNLEVKAVADIVALFLLPDDNPSVCEHFHCSASGDEERTEVYLIPRQDFPHCLIVRKLVEKGLFPED